MRVVKFLILGAAVAAGVGAIALVQGEIKRARMAAPAPEATPAAPKIEKTQVLVAAKLLKRGHILRDDDLEWRDWPKEMVAETFITRRAGAEGGFVGAVVKTSLAKGEPVLPTKIVKLNHPGALAAMLRPGLRGYSIKMQQETGVGGFIAPGNYVDIILTRKHDLDVRQADGSKSVKSIILTDTLLRTVRVLAVDDQLDDEGDAHFDMKRTVTLEVTPVQAELLALAERAGRVSLALRSIAELVDENGKAKVDPMPVLAVDLATFTGAALGGITTSDRGAPKPTVSEARRPAPPPAPIIKVAPTPAPAPPRAPSAVTILRYTTLSETKVDAPADPAADNRSVGPSVKRGPRDPQARRRAGEAPAPAPSH
ncbi:MAG: Flp pilus assembly protein CpaB [Neomegalonema sp.]|nr:Flp pilus assembly protein CpaB [Neomegalonema sp.]